MKLNFPLVKSMLTAFVGGAAIAAAQRKIADHQIGRTQTALRWGTVVGGAIALEALVTAAEKHFGLDDTNGKTAHLFTK